MIKVVLILCVLGLGWSLLRGSSSANKGAVRRLVSVAVGLLGILAVLLPDTLTWLANQVGVGRGTDLLLYGLVVAFACATVAAWQRMHRLEERLARLTRELALRTVDDRQGDRL
jgi:hypothetical protein